jgi:hypothetical protein
VLAAVAGFGGAAVLLPLLVTLFGVREAIPILTVAQLLGNLSRAWFNRSELDLPVVGLVRSDRRARHAGRRFSLRFGSASVSDASHGHFSDRCGVVYRRAGTGSTMRLQRPAFAIVACSVFSPPYWEASGRS